MEQQDMHVPYDELITFAAHETEPSVSAAIAAHVAVCAKCAATVNYFDLVGEAVRAEATDLPSPTVLAQVYGLFSVQAQPQPGWLQMLDDIFFLGGRRLASSTSILIFIVLNLLLYSGAILAFNYTSDVSQNAVVGDLLYPTKTMIEDTRLVLIQTDIGKVQRNVDLAGVRVEEIGILVDRQQYTGIPITAAKYETHVQRAMELLEAIVKKNPTQARALAAWANTKLSQYTNTLGVLMQGLPEEINPTLASAISVSSSAISTLTILKNTPAVTPFATITSTPIASSATSNSISADSQPSTKPPVAPTTASGATKPPGVTATTSSNSTQPAVVPTTTASGSTQPPVVPKTAPPSSIATPLPRHLANGTLLKEAIARNGKGELSINNSLDLDAVAALTTMDNANTLSVYVRSKSKLDITRIPDGTYKLFFMVGEDWDGVAGKFTRQVQYWVFEDTLLYKTTSTQNTIWSVTVDAFVGGTANTNSVDPSQFPIVR
jgi:hypothetical protein